MQPYLERSFIHNDKGDKANPLIHFRPNLCSDTELYKMRYLFENELNKTGIVRLM
jgi:hypothetical protein